jgi:hypothetical protein
MKHLNNASREKKYMSQGIIFERTLSQVVPYMILAWFLLREPIDNHRDLKGNVIPTQH